MWTDENRASYERQSARYPSDLTDEEWALVERKRASRPTWTWSQAGFLT